MVIILQEGGIIGSSSYQNEQAIMQQPDTDSDVTASVRRDGSNDSNIIKENINNGTTPTSTSSSKKAPFHLVPIKEPEESTPSSGPKKRYRGLSSVTITSSNRSQSTETDSRISSTGSERSTSSGISIGSTKSGESVPIPRLHGRLMRTHKHKDPHRYYEIKKVLGDGSMGSVSKVVKKRHAVGGSARAKFVKSEHQKPVCWGFFNFCNPWLFCPVNNADDSDSDDEDNNNNNNSESEGPHKKKSNRKKRRGKKKNRKDQLLESIEEAKDHDKENKQKVLHRSASSMVTYGQKVEVSYALKSIHLDRVKDSTFRSELRNEVAILQRLDHPHIVKAIETFDYRDRLFLVLELCSGGDLYSRDPYDELQACRIVKSVLDAVAYMHSKEITHRDLKFEVCNML